MLARDHNTPIPVGPSILWAENARKSMSRARTSTVTCGTDWAPSTRMSAPAAWARSASRPTGLMVPSTLDMAVTERSFAPSKAASRPVRSRRPSMSTGR